MTRLCFRVDTPNPRSRYRTLSIIGRPSTLLFSEYSFRPSGLVHQRIHRTTASLTIGLPLPLQDGFRPLTDKESKF